MRTIITLFFSFHLFSLIAQSEYSEDLDFNNGKQSLNQYTNIYLEPYFGTENEILFNDSIIWTCYLKDGNIKRWPIDVKSFNLIENCKCKVEKSILTYKGNNNYESIIFYEKEYANLTRLNENEFEYVEYDNNGKELLKSYYIFDIEQITSVDTLITEDIDTGHYYTEIFKKFQAREK